MKRRRARLAVPSRPWTPAEDERLRGMLACGLASEHWHVEFPDRTFGDIATRRLDLRLPSARLL